MTSLVGMAAPLLATSLFAFFSSPAAPLYVPGAAFYLSAVLMAVSFAVLWSARREAGLPSGK